MLYYCSFLVELLHSSSSSSSSSFVCLFDFFFFGLRFVLVVFLEIVLYCVSLT